MSSQTIRILVALAALAILASGIWFFLPKSPPSEGAPAPKKPLRVDVAQAQVRPTPILLEAVGQVQPEHSVQIRPQVNGMLREVYFAEGQPVAKGQKLFLIDPAPYRAQAASARAAWENAQAQVERLAPLAGKRYITPQDFDNARTAADQARAALEQAQINLGYTTIEAPISGRTGSIGAKAGNIVAPSDAAPLVTINQIQPILVQYSLPQERLEQVRRHRAAGTVRVFITREDGSGELGSGELVFVDNGVDLATGTITLKARLANRDERLWPGQYVGVRMQLAVQPDAVVVPASAVQTGPDGNFVYRVIDGTASVQPVRIDRQVDGFAVVAEGLNGTETVVTRVPRNLRPGSKVTPQRESAGRQQSAS